MIFILLLIIFSLYSFATNIRNIMELTDKNYYEILELSNDATIGEIRKSYKNIAKYYHPDYFNPDIINNDVKNDIFSLLAEAYLVLIDSNIKRKRYDILIKNTNENRYDLNKNWLKFDQKYNILIDNNDDVHDDHNKLFSNPIKIYASIASYGDTYDHDIKVNPAGNIADHQNYVILIISSCVVIFITIYILKINIYFYKSIDVFCLNFLTDLSAER